MAADGRAWRPAVRPPRSVTVPACWAGTRGGGGWSGRGPGARRARAAGAGTAGRGRGGRDCQCAAPRLGLQVRRHWAPRPPVTPPPDRGVGGRLAGAAWARGRRGAALGGPGVWAPWWEWDVVSLLGGTGQGAGGLGRQPVGVVAVARVVAPRCPSRSRRHAAAEEADGGH